MKPNVITLCGSTRFKKEYLEVTKWLTLQNNIVISVGLFGQADGDNLTKNEKIMLDKLHKQKIDLANEIFVIDPEKYIGNSTKTEIEYALTHNIKIRYLHEEQHELAKWKSEFYNRKEIENWNQ